MKNKKVVYVPMGADLIHSGHINIIEKAKKIWKGHHWIVF